MSLLFLIIFIVMPLAEIAVFIKVGEYMGVWPTIALVILTAIAGTALLRYQGLSALNKASEALNAGRLPVESVIDGASLLVAGAFLLTPGLITDSFGFLLFIPPFRHGLARWLFARLRKSSKVHVHVERFGGGTEPGHPGGTGKPSGEGPIIEGEVIPPENDTGTRHDQRGEKSGDESSPWKP